ncbi:SOS response-associated peptidase [Rhodovarius crocodyli]|uniref:Abasic site processing protein n=1 Tax=Rhodovarius crocodyli TaxID=1979269 RepID=A0A437MPG9_9PROT|nr:SOS response-associated peptidase [Rhodovarius crocodyli]RVT99533.1 SOS response-associated peptidase [Rhodovarius crocodyli]
MCGRYQLKREPGALADYFEAVSLVPNFPPSWNIAPTQDAPVLRLNPQTGERQLNMLRWGLVPHWAKDAEGAARLMNARSDGIADKPSFREAFRKRRCLVPMDGFYEWQAEGQGGGKSRQAFAVALRDGSPMAVAGLWEGWKRPDGEWLRTFTIITVESAGRQAQIHPRMPAILPPELWDAWLGAEPAEPDELLGLLEPCPDEELAFWPISARVGKFSENDPGLLARVAADVPAALNDEPVM